MIPPTRFLLRIPEYETINIKIQQQNSDKNLLPVIIEVQIEAQIQVTISSRKFNLQV